MGESKERKEKIGMRGKEGKKRECRGAMCVGGEGVHRRR